jgi:SAM-dependent methyltransferase
MIGGAPFFAPLDSIPSGSKAVDVGCGTGVATIQIASILRSCHVYGVDLSPVPKTTKSLAPSNVEWVEGNVFDVDVSGGGEDVLNREVFQPDSLSYIFGRMLFLGLDDWSKYFGIVFRSLKSGGLIEHQDLDWRFYRFGTNECISDGWEWHRYVMTALEAAGLSTWAGSKVAPLMDQAGLEILDRRTFGYFFTPTSETPQSQVISQYVQEKLIPNYPELLRKILGVLHLAPERLEKLIQQCLKDISSEDGLYVRYTVTVARKP